MANMKLAIGIGRAIMKGETRRVFACLANLLSANRPASENLFVAGKLYLCNS